jgi:cephalosporin-C deacetylase-like acetyl esterase
MKRIPTLFLLTLSLLVGSARAQLPFEARPLEPEPDFSARMVAGIDSLALRLIEQSKSGRKPTRDKLRACLGMSDPRVPFDTLEWVGTMRDPALLWETPACRVFRVRWPVLEGVHGEGIHILPKGTPRARVILLPDVTASPESSLDARWLVSDCEVIVPELVNRRSEFSQSSRLGIRTNLPHREWLYRQGYLLGRHLIGMEIQKTLAVVDWFKSAREQVPVIVAGVGEGGLVALHSAALDERIDAAYVAGYFGPRESVWQEPIDRNVFGLLRDFGDAELASLIAPRPLVVHDAGWSETVLPGPSIKGVRAVAAPGKIERPTFSLIQAEVDRARALRADTHILCVSAQSPLEEILAHLLPGKPVKEWGRALGKDVVGAPGMHPAIGRQERLVQELELHLQRSVGAAEAERHAFFWRPLPMQKMAGFEERIRSERGRFWKEVIGRLPDPDRPMNPQGRLVRETATVSIYEVTLDVWQDVFAWGWLCVPKGMGAGEKRPVIVCQHGLEGLPEYLFNEDPNAKGWGSYKAFALRLAEQGFVTFAPHNPYRGRDVFRTLQRKLNPLGLTLFSVIIGQHQRILEWLQSLSFVVPDKIGFYGLSYGGKSAMRIPAVLDGYCLSICSGDFNEWVRKCVSTELPMSYVFTSEYEIWEWNLGRTFNYAEMAALIAPRPFMVERGHNDGVGIDEWVNYEFAKVRRLYGKLGIPQRTAIEHFDGPHTIHGVGTFQFLREHLGRQ